MSRRLAGSAALLFLPLLISCQRGTPGGTPTTPDTPPAIREEFDLTAEEVKNYLDGKPLELPEEKAEKGKPNRTVTMSKEGVTAVQISNASRANNDPWEHEVTFIYDTGMGSYAVIARVQHRVVEQKQAFFGFKLNRVEKQ